MTTQNVFDIKNKINFVILKVFHQTKIYLLSVFIPLSYTLFFKLQKAEGRAAKEGWIDVDDVEKKLGVSEA